MTSFTKQINIEATKENVWATVSNLGDVYKFHPGVTKSYYTSDNKEGVGATRVCELRPMCKVEEIASKWVDGESFVLDIIPIEKAPPVKNFTASLSLEIKGPKLTAVVINIKYGMKLGVFGNILNALVVKSQMEKAIDGLLLGMKIHIEEGIEIVDSKSLHLDKSAA